MPTLVRVLAGAVPVIAGMVAAAFLTPPDFPLLLRQVLLFVWGVGGILLAERLLFGPGAARIGRALGLAVPRRPAVLVALAVSVPMWAFLPLYGSLTGTPVGLTSDWLPIFVGVILVNGLTEEVIHRGFVFGHLRREQPFARAAATGAAVFAAQHLYLLATIGPVAGLASVALAAFLAFPLALLYERGGSSLVAPAVLHTSSNAPMMLFASGETAAAMVLPHMGVVLVSMYLSFLLLPRQDGTDSRGDDDRPGSRTAQAQ